MIRLTENFTDIEEIFRYNSEPYFRQEKRELVHELAQVVS